MERNLYSKTMLRTLSKNQKLFTVCIGIQSVLFFYLLYLFIGSGNFNLVILVSLMYGVTLSLTGLLLGYRDKGTNGPSLGFEYHLITYLIVNLIGAIFLMDFMGLGYKSGLMIAGNLIFWGIGLFVHYFFAKRNQHRY